MRVLFLACLTPKTGNCTTAERIRNHMEAAGHSCVLCDTREFSSASDVSGLMMQENFHAALAIHLFKGGRLLLDQHVPFGVVFGGTDMNEDVKDQHKRAVMEEVLRKARFAVAFTEALRDQAIALLGCERQKIHVLPQGIETRAVPGFRWSSFLQNTGVYTKQVEDVCVFLLVCGVRRVKDPLFLLEAFSEWHGENPRVVLIIIGPKIDPVYAAEVEERVKRSNGVFLAADVSREELHAAMQRSFALVNSSLSEGMSAAVLEAMDLGLPVVARDIPGNAAIVQHEVTGLLFSTPQEFVSMSKKLVDDRALQETMVRNGKNYITTCHNLMKERESYQALLETLR